MGIPGERKKGTKVVFEAIMTANFPKLMFRKLRKHQIA